jgi:hypothetical protein
VLSGTRTYIGFSAKAFAFNEYSFRGAGGNVTGQAYYYTANGTEKVLSSFVSGSNFFLDGPVTEQPEPEVFTSRWSPPSDWAPSTLTLELEGGGAFSEVAYWTWSQREPPSFDYAHFNSMGALQVLRFHRRPQSSP